MNCLHAIAIALFVGAGVLFTGCSSDTSTNEPGQSAATANVSMNPADTEAIRRSAADFLDAVLHGDSNRASARLTPQAMQRTRESGMPFAQTGLESASFRIGEVRAPAVGQAIVQCVLTDNSLAGSPKDEEVCLLLRQIDSDWRVSGIAAGTEPSQPWVLLDFETGKSTSIPRQPSQQQPSGNGLQPVGPTVRPSPPRTVQNPPSTALQ
jgi:hypothetical protein